MKSDRLAPATRNEDRNVISKWPTDKHSEKTPNKHKLLSSGSSSLDGTSIVLDLTHPNKTSTGPTNQAFEHRRSHPSTSLHCSRLGGVKVAVANHFERKGEDCQWPACSPAHSPTMECLHFNAQEWCRTKVQSQQDRMQSYRSVSSWQMNGFLPNQPHAIHTRPAAMSPGGARDFMGRRLWDASMGAMSPELGKAAQVRNAWNVIYNII